MSTSASAAPSIPATSTPDSKILSDLATVIEKINLCTSMLYPLNSTYEIDQDESLLTIIGFLEACCPRVRELIEAGMTGALQEDTVVKCLTVNDMLLQVLEFVEHPETCNKKQEEEAKEEEPKKIDAVVDNFDAFGIMDEDDLLDDFDSKPAATDTAVQETAKVEQTTNHLDDLLLAPVPTPVNDTSTSTETTNTKEDTATDDFDDFFNTIETLRFNREGTIDSKRAIRIPFKLAIPPMISYKEKKEAIESLLSQNIHPSLEALQRYFPTLIGQCQSQNAVSDLVNIANYLCHKYISRNSHVQLVQFHIPVRKEVRLYSRKRAAKKAAPTTSISISMINDNGNDTHNAKEESHSSTSIHETTKSLLELQDMCEDKMDMHQTHSFRFHTSLPKQPIPCTQKADAKGFALVKNIVYSMMERGDWPNYPTVVKIFPDLGKKYQKQSLTNTISRLRLQFDSDNHDGQFVHEKDSIGESQEFGIDKLDEDSIGEATEDSKEHKECEWNEDTFIHRQIACTEQSDPKGYVKIRNIVLDLLQKGEKPSYPLFVEQYPKIVAKYRERSLMSAITKVVAEEGKLFLLETSDSENEDDDEDTAIMDSTDFDQNDEMDVIGKDNEIHFSKSIPEEKPQGTTAPVASVGKSTIQGNSENIEKPILKEQGNLLHVQSQRKCPTCFSINVDSQRKCSSCSTFLTETFEDEVGNKTSLNSNLESDESVDRGRNKRKIIDMDTDDLSTGENDAPKAKKQNLQISPDNVSANVVNEVDESAIDSSILVCESRSDGSPSVEYTAVSVLHPMINCNDSTMDCVAPVTTNNTKEDVVSRQTRHGHLENYEKGNRAIVKIPFSCANNPKDYKRVKASVSEMLDEGLETSYYSFVKKYPEFEERYLKNSLSSVISAFKHQYKKKKSQQGRKVVGSDPQNEAPDSQDKNEDENKTVEVNSTDRSFSLENNPLVISDKVSALFFNSATEEGDSITQQNESCKDKVDLGKSTHSASSSKTSQERSDHTEHGTAEELKENLDTDKSSSGRSVEEKPHEDHIQEDKFDFINDGSYSALNDIQLPLDIDSSDSKSLSSQQNPGEITEQIVETPKKTFAVESFDLKSPFGVEKMSIAIWFNTEILKVNTPSILSKCKEYSEKFVELGFYNEDMIKSYCTVEIIDSEDFQWMALVHRMCLKKWINNPK